MVQLGFIINSIQNKFTASLQSLPATLGSPKYKWQNGKVVKRGTRSCRTGTSFSVCSSSPTAWVPQVAWGHILGGNYWRRKWQSHEVWGGSSCWLSCWGSGQHRDQSELLPHTIRLLLGAEAQCPDKVLSWPPQHHCHQGLCACPTALRLAFQHPLITFLQMKSLNLSQHGACWCLLCHWQ